MKTDTLEIKPGRFYRTRDGRKARVYETDGHNVAPIHGAIFSKEFGWVPEMWTIEGCNMGRREATLISEWIDAPEVNWSAMPAWANWVAMRPSGDWLWSTEKPGLRSNRWTTGQEYYDPIPSEYAPTFTGPWTESLVQRPQKGDLQ